MQVLLVSNAFYSCATEALAMSYHLVLVILGNQGLTETMSIDFPLAQAIRIKYEKIIAMKWPSHLNTPTLWGSKS